MPTLIGPAVDRADGRLKVTGGAKYAAEFAPAGNVCHAVLVSAKVGKGRVTAVDDAAAAALPGVLAVLSYRNTKPLKHVPPSEPTTLASQMPGVELMLTDRVVFYGQYVAVVVAETLEQAEQAARVLKVTYAAETPQLDFAGRVKEAVPPANRMAKDEPADTERGKPADAFAAAAVKVAGVYSTPNENHNPMEMHATVAAWDGAGGGGGGGGGGKLTVWDATQGVVATKAALATALELKPDDVRVVDPYVGGGFGCKGTTWPHTALAAVAARAVGRPVRLMLTRGQMFTGVGYRARTRQDVRLGAKADGTLQAFAHDSVSQTSDYSEFLEAAALPTRHLYACDTAATTHRLVKVDTHQPNQMRAPGECTGVFAFECAMDELAVALKMDPVELRLKNYAEVDPENGKPFTSKSLRQCYQQAAERFGWAKRTPEPGSMTDGRWLVGYGMATATYPANRLPAEARVRAFADGSVVVQSATQDLGTGTYTIMAQTAADELGLPAEAVKAQIADTNFPKAGISGGSSTAASVGSAVMMAAAGLREKLIVLAVADVDGPLYGLKPGDVAVAAGGKLVANADATRSVPIRDVVARSGKNVVEGEFSAKPGDEKERFSRHAFGAVFVEVRVDPALGIVRVPRVVAAYAAGRILNQKTARSQFLGGLAFAHGMALLEATVTDGRTGRVVNDDLSEYLVPVNADVQQVDVIQVPEADPFVNPIGVKGVGEIGIVGAPAAIANAVYHATGKRVRDLPITADKLL